MNRERETINSMKFTRGFIEDIAKLAYLSKEHNTDSLRVAFNTGDGRKAVVDMTFSVEEVEESAKERSEPNER